VINQTQAPAHLLAQKGRRADSKHRNASCARKTEAGLEKGLANLWRRRKIMKKPTPLMVKKSNGKSPLKPMSSEYGNKNNHKREAFSSGPPDPLRKHLRT
jgi:hypothetical protein